MTENAPSFDTIFCGAIEVASAEERAAFITRACGSDEELRGRVERLVAAHFQAGSFLESPPTTPTASMDSASSTDGPGSVIGNYKLLQPIGEGGMGTVYMAEQTTPVRRTIALKLIKPGMDSRQILARFGAERQALALMDHPNIAKVFDAGTTDTGRPYFVMELVKGIAITRFCDERRLTTRERLALAIPVCQAIQHAHQKGVIHRDLKPSNVLVALYDDKPVPKVIDFGVAKATGPRLTEQTLYTEFGAIVGTLEYMSPEQAQLNQLDIDTRSDIYSLGVLLYELLTGSTPLERKRLKETAFLEVLRVIREDESPRPSMRLSTTEELATIAACRNIEPQRLSGLVRGELDWIVMKALEKDRNRRYETAIGLAADLRRYLDDEPVQACPPSGWYRFRKLAHRNKAALIVAGLIALAMFGAVGVLAVSNVLITNEKNQKETALLKARASEKAATDQKVLADQQRAHAVANMGVAREQTGLARRHLYVAQMNLAQQAWDQSNLGHLRSLLGRQRPEPGQEDLRGFEWYYWWRLAHGYQADLYVSDSQVMTVAYSPDGATLATGSIDKVVRLFDAGTGRLKFELPGHTDFVLSVAFSPDGRTLASGSWDRTVRLWKVATGTEITTLTGHEGRVWSVQFSPDGTTLASANDDNTILLWDLGTRKSKPPLKREGGPSHDVAWTSDGLAFTSDGTLLASVNGDSTVTLWDTTSGALTTTLDGRTGKRFSVAISPDGKSLASGGDDREIKLWDLTTNQEKSSLRGHTDLVGEVAFSPDGKILASGSRDNTVRLWDANTGAAKATLKGHASAVYSVAFSPDGGTLASASEDNSVKLWPVRASAPKDLLEGHIGGVRSVTFSPDGTMAATGGVDQKVRLWDTSTGTLKATLEGHKGLVECLAFSPDGRTLASAGTDHAIRLWDTVAGKAEATLNGHAKRIRAARFSPDGKQLATAGMDGTVRLWNTTTGAADAVFRVPIEQVSCLAVAPDLKTLATGSEGENNTILLWDLGTKSSKVLSRGKGYGVLSLAFSPDGRILASGGRDRKVVLWELTTGQSRPPFDGHSNWVSSLSFSPDGRTLASASYDQTVILWDVAMGETKLTLKCDAKRMSCVTFSPDGTIMATNSGNDAVRLWRAASAAEVRAKVK